MLFSHFSFSHRCNSDFFLTSQSKYFIKKHNTPKIFYKGSGLIFFLAVKLKPKQTTNKAIKENGDIVQKKEWNRKTWKS